MYRIELKRPGCWLPLQVRGMPVAMVREFRSLEQAEAEKARLEADGETVRVTDRQGKVLEMTQ